MFRPPPLREGKLSNSELNADQSVNQGNPVPSDIYTWGGMLFWPVEICGDDCSRLLGKISFLSKRYNGNRWFVLSLGITEALCEV